MTSPISSRPITPDTDEEHARGRLSSGRELSRSSVGGGPSLFNLLFGSRSNQERTSLGGSRVSVDSDIDYENLEEIKDSDQFDDVYFQLSSSIQSRTSSASKKGVPSHNRRNSTVTHIFSEQIKQDSQRQSLAKTTGTIPFPSEEKADSWWPFARSQQTEKKACSGVMAAVEELIVSSPEISSELLSKILHCFSKMQEDLSPLEAEELKILFKELIAPDYTMQVRSKKRGKAKSFRESLVEILFTHLQALPIKKGLCLIDKEFICRFFNKGWCQAIDSSSGKEILSTSVLMRVPVIKAWLVYSSIIHFKYDTLSAIEGMMQLYGDGVCEEFGEYTDQIRTVHFYTASKNVCNINRIEREQIKLALKNEGNLSQDEVSENCMRVFVHAMLNQELDLYGGVLDLDESQKRVVEKVDIDRLEGFYRYFLVRMQGENGSRIEREDSGHIPHTSLEELPNYPKLVWDEYFPVQQEGESPSTAHPRSGSAASLKRIGSNTVMPRFRSGSAVAPYLNSIESK